MKYYKRINNGEATENLPWEIGKIYSEDSHPDKNFNSTKRSVCVNSDRWREVPESEYLLQEAKEKYPIGTVFIPAHVDKGRYTVAGNWRLETQNSNTIIVDTVETYNEWTPCIYYSPNKKWAKIISKPEEIMKKEEFVLPEKWMVKVTPENADILTKWKIKISKGEFTDNADEYDYVDYEGSGEKDKIIYPLITFEQFKKYVLKQDTMEKKIIGYKLVKPEYATAVRRIIGCDPKNDHFGINTLNGKCDIELLKRAGVLDLWFEPVYKNVKPEVEIKGFKAQIFDDKVIFGCQEYSKEFILTLRKCIESNAFDFSFNGKSFVREIEEIAKYYERNS